MPPDRCGGFRRSRVCACSMSYISILQLRDPWFFGGELARQKHPTYTPGVYRSLVRLYGDTMPNGGRLKCHCSKGTFATGRSKRRWFSNWETLSQKRWQDSYYHQSGVTLIRATLVRQRAVAHIGKHKVYVERQDISYYFTLPPFPPAPVPPFIRSTGLMISAIL